MRRLLLWGPVAALLAGGAALLAAESRPPTPASVLGFEPCSDYTLATHEQLSAYFRRLDAASDRLELIEIGQSAGGRTQLMAIISSEANLRRLGRYQDIARRLARARGLSDADARALAAEGRAVVWIDFGLHSTEVAHAQAAPLVAYRTVTDESREMQAIRDQVIFLLVPDMNPDGTALVADWYMKHVGGPYERTTPPELYQRHAGHDNNRDWFMFNLPESRNIARQLYIEWLPQIVYNQHQAAPFPARIFVPPFDEPMNPQIPPLVIRGIDLVGSAISRRLEREGKVGGISRIGFDTWWNGGMRTAPYFHNMIGILTETAHASATPATYDAERFPRTFANGWPTLAPSTYYPSPYRGGAWHLRDSCEYIASASIAVLDIGAARRFEWLYDIYRMGRAAITAGARELYVIPAEQWDVSAAASMVDALRLAGVEVDRATREFTVGSARYAGGSYLIRGAQAFRPYIADLLNPQRYPERRRYPGGPPDRPYDITGWTLPLQMHVGVDYHTDAAPPDAAGFTPAGETRARATRIPSGAGPLAIDSRVNDAFTLVNRLLKAGEPVGRLTVPLLVDGGEWPPGTFIVAGRSREPVRAAAEGLAVRLMPLKRPPSGPTLALRRPPRVGVYRAWTRSGDADSPGGNPDEGWTRWVLEQFEFAYDTVSDGDLRTGGLNQRYDVVVLPDATHHRMLDGLSLREAPAHFTGGMTERGVGHLQAFVERGGTLVALDSATELPRIAFALPVDDVTRGRRDTELYAPGSLVRVLIDPAHPIGFGMPPDTAAFVAQSPAFEIRPRGTLPTGEPGPAAASATDDAIQVVARYPDRSLLLSGWLLGEPVLANRAAVVDVPLGRGHVVLVGFRAQHRGQAYGTFKLLFNAILRGGAAGHGEGVLPVSG